MRLLQQKLIKYDAPQKTKEAGIYPYFRAISSEQDTEVVMSGRKVLMFGSNSYLGLTNHPKVKEAAIAATQKYGTGMAGSRFLNGTLDIHVELEHKLAKFVGKEEAIIFSAGMLVNVGVIPALTGKDDYIIWDELNHASIVEGVRLSFSNTMKFKHNDMESLEKRLQSCNPDKIKMIIVDGVFSMEGDVTKLEEIVALAHKYNANIYVDEAHSLGVFGKNGQGVCHHLGLTSEVDLIMGTFSKSFASIGGFIATDSITANWLRHNARSYIFSASPTPAAMGAASAAPRYNDERTRTFRTSLAADTLRSRRLPLTQFRDRTHIDPDNTSIYTRQRKNLYDYSRFVRRGYIRQSCSITCRSS